MSKGFGSLQADILDALRSQDKVSANRLAWEIAEKNARIKRERVSHPLPSGAIEDSFYKSFRRSISLLEKRRSIKTRQRKLQSLTDLVELYPFMTRDLRIKELRHRLLPHVQKYVHMEGSKYDLEENELYLEQRETDEVRSLWRKGWLELEDRLCMLLGTIPTRNREMILAILTRGRQVFMRARSGLSSNTLSRFKYEEALRTLIATFADCSSKSSSEDPTLSEDLIAYYQQYFPDSALRHVALKSQLHGMWESPKLGAARLTLPFKKYLLTADPALISSLPGHVPASGDYRDFSRTETVFDELLEHLFGRDVFRPFQFLSLT
jgi:hypothetical protein